MLHTDGNRHGRVQFGALQAKDSGLLLCFCGTARFFLLHLKLFLFGNRGQVSGKMAIHIFPGGIRIVCGDGIHHLTVRLNGFLVNPLVIEFAKELYGVCNHRQQLAYHAVLGTAGKW